MCLNILWPFIVYEIIGSYWVHLISIYIYREREREGEREQERECKRERESKTHITSRQNFSSTNIAFKYHIMPHSIVCMR